MTANLSKTYVIENHDLNKSYKTSKRFFHRIGLWRFGGLSTYFERLQARLADHLPMEEGRKQLKSTNTNNQTEKEKFQLCQHPWLSLLAVMAASIFSMVLAGIVSYGLVVLKPAIEGEG